MINVQAMLVAINSRVVIWDFMDIYRSREEAMHLAAKLFANGASGAQVKQTKTESFIVLSWTLR